MTTGSLTLIIGPMYAGKTTKLLDLIKVNKHKSLLIFNHESDTRYNKSSITTHDNKSEECIPIKKVASILENELLNTRQHIFIDEGQFFDDLYDNVLKLVNMGKDVYISGLDGDFKQEPFGNGDILKLIPHSDEFYKLTSKCYYCKNSAPFTKRLCDSKEQVIVGSTSIYQPVCRQHLTF